MLNFRGCTRILGPGIMRCADPIRSLRSLRSIKLNLRNCTELQKEAIITLAEAIGCNLSLEAVSLILLGTSLGPVLKGSGAFDALKSVTL